MRRELTTWREDITKEMGYKGDSWDNVVQIYPPDLDLDREFDGGYGSENGEPFTLWTKTRVYFPACYDGSELVASVPRDPCEIATQHIGGG
jgi:hypothetical protein